MVDMTPLFEQERGLLMSILELISDVIPGMMVHPAVPALGRRRQEDQEGVYGHPWLQQLDGGSLDCMSPFLKYKLVLQIDVSPRIFINFYVNVCGCISECTFESSFTWTVI